MTKPGSVKTDSLLRRASVHELGYIKCSVLFVLLGVSLGLVVVLYGPAGLTQDQIALRFAIWWLLLAPLVWLCSEHQHWRAASSNPKPGSPTV
jgi:hypothetical protein